MTWPLAPLGNVATLAREGVAPGQISAGTLFVGLENITKGGGFESVAPVDEGDIASTKFSFSSQHLLYGKLRPYLAKIALPEFEGVCSTDIIPILPGPRLDRRYLAHYLRTPKMVALASDRATGANLPRLSPNVLLEFPIPLPPLAEQRRIAAILDQAEELRAKRRAAIALLDQLPQSIFLEMFGDPESNPMNLPKSPIGGLANIKTGGTPSRTREENYGGGIPWVKTGEVTGQPIRSTEESLTEEGFRSSNCEIFPAGSVVIAMYGQGKTRGRCSVLEIEATTNQACAVVLPSSQLSSTFLFEQLSMSYEQLRQMGRGGNQPNLNLSLVSGFKVLVPPKEQQDDFAGRVEAVRRTKAAHRSALADLDALVASLQAEAFGGSAQVIRELSHV